MITAEEARAQYQPPHHFTIDEVLETVESEINLAIENNERKCTVLFDDYFPLKMRRAIKKQLRELGYRVSFDYWVYSWIEIKW